MSVQSSNIERELGVIAESLKHIQESIIENRRLNNEIAAEQSILINKVATIENTISKIEPVTEQFVRWKAIGTGALLTLGLVFTTLGITLATVNEIASKVWKLVVG